MDEKPKVSYISPVYYKSNPYVQQTYESLKKQNNQAWEWLILLNNGGDVSEEIKKDPQVKIFEDSDKDQNIGRLKKFLSLNANAPIVAELDADDMLTKDATDEIINAFKDEKIVFAYSNTVEFHEGSWAPRTYGEYWGWKTRPFNYEGKELKETLAFKPIATSIWRIEWAPNHVRSWKKEAYQKIGGHDESLPSGDDHDLICRFYLEYGEKSFKHIDKGIYLYRVHDGNHSIVFNYEVQDVVQKNYFNYSRNIAVKWSDGQNLRKIDLSKNSQEWDSFEKLELKDIKEIKSDTVGVIKAHNTFQEHPNPIELMEEIWRILAHGGILFLEVISTESKEAFANPLNKSYWNSNSIKYYTQKSFADQIGFKGKFQEWRNETFYPTKNHEENEQLIVQADLSAIKKETPIIPGAQWM